MFTTSVVFSFLILGVSFRFAKMKWNERGEIRFRHWGLFSKTHSSIEHPVKFRPLFRHFFLLHSFQSLTPSLSSARTCESGRGDIGMLQAHMSPCSEEKPVWGSLLQSLTPLNSRRACDREVEKSLPGKPGRASWSALHRHRNWREKSFLVQIEGYQ
jgi:hypothetical protein